MDTQMVDVGTTELFVRSAGDPSAPVLVLLHGWPDTGRGWDHLAPLLVDRYRLVIPDNRGFGKSALPVGTDNYRMSLLLGDVRGLIEWTGASRVSIVGHDFGSALAWQAGTFLTDRLHRIVCLAAPHPQRMHEFAGDPRMLKRAFYVWLLNLGEQGESVLTAGGFERFADWIFGDVITDDERQAYIDEWSEPGRFTAMAEWYRATYRPSLLDPIIDIDLPPVTTPVRYVHGLNDWAFLPEMASGSGRYVDAEYDETSLESSHWMIRTHTHEVANLITDWLDRT